MLIVAFLTIICTNVGSNNGIFLSFFQLFVKSFKSFIVVVTKEIDFCFAVALQAPPHGEIAVLTDNIHLFNQPVALGTIQLPDTHMLRM